MVFCVFVVDGWSFYLYFCFVFVLYFFYYYYFKKMYRD